MSTLAIARQQTSIINVLATLACVSLYAGSVILLLRDYAAIEWSIYGYMFKNADVLEYIFCIGSLMLFGLIVPREMNSPSSLILIILFAFLIVPTIVCLTFMGIGSDTAHYIISGLLLLCYTVCVMACRHTVPRSTSIPRQAHANLPIALSAISVLLMLFLYYRFSSIMSFVSLDTLYVQRERGSATNFIDGYAQTYSQYVFSTALIAFGLFKRNLIFVGVGLVGSLLNYSITAEKAGVMYPAFVFMLYFALASERKFLVSTNFFMALLGTVTLVCLYTRLSSDISEFFCWYLGTRTILTPGAFVVHYADFFSERGYTYFSHIRGLNLVFPIPTSFAGDPRWPSIGIIVGEDLFGFAKLNANASFVASDGIASLGMPGIVVAFGILTGILLVVDRVGRGVPNALLLPILLPIALTLTNGSALSVLTSTGGLFWILVLKFGFKNRVFAQVPTAKRE